MSTLVLHQETSPSALSQAVAPVARVWKGVQDGIAKVLGFENSGNLSGAVTGLGLATLIAAGMVVPLAPILSTVGATVTTAGVVGLVENTVTNTLAKSDEKKIKKIIL